VLFFKSDANLRLYFKSASVFLENFAEILYICIGK